MTVRVAWSSMTTDGRARVGILTTPHGSVPTPNFMAVGTRATVRTIDTEDLERLGADIVLANTYHLMLRPGAEIVASQGGLHGFMAWNGPILTDSGGYQVLSLEPAIAEEGLRFRSTYDGSMVDLTPERAAHIQDLLGSDIAMVLDVPVPLPSPRENVEQAMHRTLRWAARAKEAKQRDDTVQFGIVQGGAERDLRRESARETADIGFPGYGIGGLAVGETMVERGEAIDAVVPELPDTAIRYVMGLGDTEGMLDAIARGVDLFDCVLPTRLARHGKALTRVGDLSIKRAEWDDDPRPLEDDCPCPACRRHSRSYLRHLHRTKELTGQRLLTLHNLTYTYGLLRDARAAITDGTFDAWRTDVVDRRRQGIDRAAD